MSAMHCYSELWGVFASPAYLLYITYIFCEEHFMEMVSTERLHDFNFVEMQIFKGSIFTFNGLKSIHCKEVTGSSPQV